MWRTEVSQRNQGRAIRPTANGEIITRNEMTECETQPHGCITFPRSVSYSAPAPVRDRALPFESRLEHFAPTGVVPFSPPYTHTPQLPGSPSSGPNLSATLPFAALCAWLDADMIIFRRVVL